MPNNDFSQLQQDVYDANIRLVKAGLVVLTWGNVSAIDRERGVIAIKPSGVSYDTLQAEDIVLVSLETGQPLDGQTLRPSSDTPTHVCLYQRFANIGGIAHTHSRHATSWAQAGREIPCYGTTHADTFHGPIPLCRVLTKSEIEDAYEWNTGVVIADYFEENQLDPAHVPGVLLAHHAPFAWGESADKAVENAIIVEEVAALAWLTESIAHDAQTAPEAITTKHFERKHGADAYYGQAKI